MVFCLNKKIEALKNITRQNLKKTKKYGRSGGRKIREIFKRTDNQPLHWTSASSPLFDFENF
jgi:hypothetical protein